MIFKHSHSISDDVHTYVDGNDNKKSGKWSILKLIAWHIYLYSCMEIKSEKQKVGKCGRKLG